MLKPQLAEFYDVADSVCRDELQMEERSRKDSQSRAKEKEPMKREISHETLRRMSLESLLYHVLVGEGRF